MDIGRLLLVYFRKAKILFDSRCDLTGILKEGEERFEV